MAAIPACAGADCAHWSSSSTSPDRRRRATRIQLRMELAMTGYCILRAEKLTSFGSIAGSAKHTFREIPTPNADAGRTHLNKTWGAQDAAAVCAAIKARLPAKRRKDAVLAIEYLVTASPEWFRAAPAAQQNAYFVAAVRWLETRHGKANVVCINMQLDETSPHLVAYVLPLTTDGRLSAKDFLGGRRVLTQMQTEFAQLVGAPVGLQRGVEGSRATHTTAKQYAAALQKNPTLAARAPPAPTIADRITGKARQMQEEHEAAQARHTALVEQARNVAEISRHARAQQATALKRIRRDVDAAKQYQVDAAQLQDENLRLERELQDQRTSFQRQIADLKAALDKATRQARDLLAHACLLARSGESRGELLTTGAIAPQFGAIALEDDTEQSTISPSPSRV